MSSISDFITQARTAGKTDEVIRQELSTSGWQEADINQALGGVAAPTSPAPTIPAPAVSVPTIPAATVAASGMSALMKALIILVIILGGFGGYFVFSKMGAAPGSGTPVASIDGGDLSGTPNENVGQEAGGGSEGLGTSGGGSAQGAVIPFKCEDLLSTADYQGVTGLAASVTVQEDRSKPDALCSFVQAGEPMQVNGQWSMPNHVLVVGFQAINTNSAPQTYADGLKAYASWQENTDPSSTLGYVATPGVNIPGIGAQAATLARTTMAVLSSNQRYVVILVYIYNNGTEAEDFASMSKIAKIVDANLNKY